MSSRRSHSTLLGADAEGGGAAEQGDEADEAWATSGLRSLSPVLGGPHLEQHERVSRAWTRRTMARRTKHAATPPTLGACSSRSFPGASWSGWAVRDSSAWAYRGRPVAQLRVLRVRSLRHQSTWTNWGALQRCQARTARNQRRATPSRVALSRWQRRNGRRIWLSQRTAGDGEQGAWERPPNKRMKLTKSGWIWSVRGISAVPRFRCHREGPSKVALFAAYPRCSADIQELRW